MATTHRIIPERLVEVALAFALLTGFVWTNYATIVGALERRVYALWWVSIGIGVGVVVTLVYFWADGRFDGSSISGGQRRLVFALVAIGVVLGSATLLHGSWGTLLLLGASFVWATVVVARGLPTLG